MRRSEAASRSRRARGAARTLSVEEVAVDGLSVAVRRRSISTLSLRVKPPDGRVEVSAPQFVPRLEIVRIVREKRAWIEEKRAEIAASPSARADGAGAEEVAAWRAVVEAFVPALVKRWEPVLGVCAGTIVYRNMKSRWGSCQPATGRICINVRLALYPPECLEYVVVHELAHLRERGHGPAFKALMDAALPDWRARRAKLR